jgi:hypothetical protein
MTASTGRHELAQQAWSALPHGAAKPGRFFCLLGGADEHHVIID